MAARMYFRNDCHLQREVVTLFCSVTSNASSATSGLAGAGVTSFARTAQGIYTVTLDDKYNSVLHYNVSFSVDTAVDPLSGLSVLQPCFVTPDTVNTDKKFIFTTVNGSNAATDVPEGAKIWLELVLSNDSSGIAGG